MEDLIRPIQKQIQLLEVEEGELTVEKHESKTGKTTAYFALISLAIAFLKQGVKALEMAEKEFKGSRQ